jgi:hypothetical protein
MFAVPAPGAGEEAAPAQASPAPAGKSAGRKNMNIDLQDEPSEAWPLHLDYGPSGLSQNHERHLIEVRKDRLCFSVGGSLVAGFRNIQADRATGNEASTYYKLDLFAEAHFDEEIGGRMRFLLRTPIGTRARNFELFDELNEQFELRETFLFYQNSTVGTLSFGKFKLPFGPRDAFEDEPWNQPLLEYYITRTGNYDIGARWDRAWFSGTLQSGLSVTAGNTGALDTNSAMALSAQLSFHPAEWLTIGAWGKLNKMDTTPIKREDSASGLFAQFNYRNWRLLAKGALLWQGMRDTVWPDSDLDDNDYNQDEIEVLLWLRDNGGGERQLEGWYVMLFAPTIRNLPALGRRLERIDLFAHVGQVYDPLDPFEKSRERAGVGMHLLLKDTGNARLSCSAGATFDNDPSNTRPYLDRFEEINERNDRYTYWLKIALSF